MASFRISPVNLVASWAKDRNVTYPFVIYRINRTCWFSPNSVVFASDIKPSFTGEWPLVDFVWNVWVIMDR